MKIEPCPFCGSEVRYSLGTLSALCKNPECLYEGPIDDENAQKHNRLSRIVRAAELVGKLVKPEHSNSETFKAYLKACDDLIVAVNGEGGAE